MEWMRGSRMGWSGGDCQRRQQILPLLEASSGESAGLSVGFQGLQVSGLAEELGDHGVAEAFNVHDAAMAEVDELFAQAGGAAGVDAAPVDLAFFLDEGAAAGGAVVREDDVLGAARVCVVFQDAGDLGDDVAAALDGDEVADADDRGGRSRRRCGAWRELDGGAADEDRRERGDGGDLAGAADLEERRR